MTFRDELREILDKALGIPKEDEQGICDCVGLSCKEKDCWIYKKLLIDQILQAIKDRWVKEKDAEFCMRTTKEGMASIDVDEFMDGLEASGYNQCSRELKERLGI